ncbi:hypothetical protein AB0B50_40960 [Streptomyces sp. NPDC041068]|uniref:hypothetical protein n=1 Tax=Streptomyces sp. NPDC041068 TaxID=3155130 RepID=UPI0033D9C8BF
MRSRRVLVASAALLGALALSLAVTAVPAAAAVANPAPLPVTESLITEGVTIEGPLVNNLALPQVV